MFGRQYKFGKRSLNKSVTNLTTEQNRYKFALVSYVTKVEIKLKN